MPYYPFFYEPTMILILPALLFALYAQYKVQSTFNKYVRVPSRIGMTGAQVARSILDKAGLYDVSIEMTYGHLSDHYDPRTKKLRLSPEVYRGTSLASLGVAAHETGHALQHAENYVPLTLRSQIVPIASFGSTLAFPLFFIGFIFGVQGLGSTLMDLGIWLFAAVVAFHLITLPVEYNASARAMQLLLSGGYISKDEAPRTRAVLNAAALTYLAATAMAIMQLLRLIILRNSRDD